MSLIALSFLLLGLMAIALPDSLSGPVVWEGSADHGLRQADMIGLALMALGSGLIWITGLIWQWRHPR